MILVSKISSSSRRDNRHHRLQSVKRETDSLHPVCNFKVSHQVFFFCTFSTSKMKEGNGYLFVSRSLCVYYVCCTDELSTWIHERQKEKKEGVCIKVKLEWEKNNRRGWVCQVSSSSSSSSCNKMRDTRNLWYYRTSSLLTTFFYLLLCLIISYFFSNLLLFLSGIRRLLLKQWLLIAHSLQLLRNCLQSNLLLYYIRCFCRPLVSRSFSLCSMKKTAKREVTSFTWFSPPPLLVLPIIRFRRSPGLKSPSFKYRIRSWRHSKEKRTKSISGGHSSSFFLLLKKSDCWMESCQTRHQPRRL